MTHYSRILILLFLAAGFLACSNPETAAHNSISKEAAVVVSDPIDQGSAPANGRLRILSYNVLRYGSGCQAGNSTLHGYLRSIVRYASPDVAGFVKVDAIKQSPKDEEGEAPYGFADSILKYAMNAAFPGRYAVSRFTNKANANNVNLLFYDQKKLGYAGMETLVSDETDFNLFKLYLRASVTGNHPDTTFLYFILNHTESGDNSQNRDRQMAAVITALHRRFTTLPNIVSMGDFNLRNTEEAGYKSLTAGADANFRFDDPPFALDHTVKYPADWESDPDSYAQFLTTSTRKKDDKPNECGTGGGAKFWYDHMLVSPTIAGGKAGLKYAPHSFHVIGNDGNRIGRSVNADKNPNKDVSPDIAEALFQLSNKYPVMLQLTVLHRK